MQQPPQKEAHNWMIQYTAVSMAMQTWYGNNSGRPAWLEASLFALFLWISVLAWNQCFAGDVLFAVWTDGVPAVARYLSMRRCDHH